MARISRRSGPVVDFELTNTLTLIPGFTITRSFDDGELLIAFSSTIDNATGALADSTVQVHIDGQDIGPFTQFENIPNGQRITHAATFIHPIAAGTHTIELRARGMAAVGDTVQDLRTYLTVIQLPRWDAEDDIL